MVVSALLWSVSDFLAQMIELHRAGALSEGVCASICHHYSMWRTLRLGTFSLFVFAPLNTFWYRFLETILPGENFFAALGRVFCDQVGGTSLLDSGGREAPLRVFVDFFSFSRMSRSCLPPWHWPSSSSFST